MSTATVMNFLDGKWSTAKEMKENGISMDTVKAMIKDGTVDCTPVFKPFQPKHYYLTEKGKNIVEITKLVGGC